MAPAESSQTPPAAPPMAPEDAKALCARSIHIMADGDLGAFAAVIHPEAVSLDARDAPPDARGRGPAAFHATALWLRHAFADLRWDVHQIAADGDIVVICCTWYGLARQALRDLRRGRGSAPGHAANEQDIRRHAEPLVPAR